ncbi:MAG: hypothetical protein LUF30_09735, partial [Lachnospiraceae bacterium]|nr:hypothetical protein [Lachnospiraceae bacterium]
MIAPHPDIRIPKVDCTYESVNGKYVSKWEICADGQMRVHIEIPFNCEAEVELPGYAPVADIAEAGVDDANREAYFMSVAGENGTAYKASEDGKLILVAGAYDFLYQPANDLRKPYSRQTTLGRLSQDPNAIGILGKYAPAIAGI